VKTKVTLLGLMLGIVAGINPSFSRAAVLINEIMYHPASTNLLEEWFELYNPGPTNVNVSGWQITKGVHFAFPTNTTVPAGGYLVIAADIATFVAKYPGVTNFVPASAGPLAGHTIELDDNTGAKVNSVSYYNDGDWAARVLTTNGFASYGHAGWVNYAPHDGLGSSLELINPSLPNVYAHNWASSTTSNGTPGQSNSIAATNTPPFVTAVTHAPIIPQPTDAVTVSARIVDEHTNGLTVTLFYRDSSTIAAQPFTSVPMFDDGAHNDGLPADGIYAAILPAQPNGTVIEFFLQASDLEGHSRTYPNVAPPVNSLRTANLLYQVDNSVYSGSQPIYRLIMTETERAELYAIGGPNCPDYDSDAQMNATWISADGVVSGGTTTQLRYNVGVRNRGHGSRHSRPNNYHVNIPDDRSWKGLTGINLNSQYAFCQVVGSAVFRRLGVPMPESRPVQVRVNSTNIMSLSGLPDNNSFGSYAANEQYNEDFVQRAFALDPDGNSYRGIRDQAICDPSRNSVADLSWHGANYAVAVYTNAYFKQNNFLTNDWSDVIDLLAVLNTANGYLASNYAADIQQRLNVEEWMKYMAINTLLDNDETDLANGTGDDYALYRGVSDPRFLVLPYDMDTLVGRGLTATPPNHSIWRMTALAQMDRFMKTPEFAPVYFRWLKTYADTTFSPAQMNPLLDQLLKDYVPDATIATIKAFNTAQANWVLSQIPLALTVSSSLTPSNGYPHTTTASTALRGTANAIDTRAIIVAGVTSSWTAWQGTWTNNNVALNPGLNRILIQALGVGGTEIARTNFDVWYDDGSVASLGGTLPATTVWTPAGGPYLITNTLTIPSGLTLTIQPGTTVYFGSGVNLVVADGGQLLAEGMTAAPIRFTVAPGSGVNWGGLTINGSVGSPETRIAYAFFEGNGGTCIHAAGGTLYLDHTTFGTTTHQYVSLDGASFTLSSCIFPTSTAAFELVHGTGGIKAGGHGIVRDCFFGTTTGYNDIMDFTGGNREQSQPIIQYYNNVFSGGSDDILDLDGTDAWIEGNIFLHVHRNGAPDSSSAVSGGNTGNDTSQITIIGNLFFDCDQAATAKQTNFFTLLNNTIVRMNDTGGTDSNAAVVNVRDLDPGPPTSFGQGFYLEGNIIWDTALLVRNYDAANTTVTFSNNILSVPWAGPGGGNSTNNPLLKYIPQVSETYFNTWQEAQILRDWFSLLPGSPALGTGPNGRDKGGVIPLGASIAGEPQGTNNLTTATLTVGVVRSGNGIPASGWPNGSGYTHYKWRLDAGAWSVETPASTPISLTGLADGVHHVEVSGKRDLGSYQDDPLLASDATVTTSRFWTVSSSYVPPAAPKVRINEILAQNSTTLTNGATTPDLIELYNYGAAALDLSGMGLSDNASLPYKFTFTNGTPLLGAGQFLVVYADSQVGPGIHLGFGLKASGDDLYLRDKAGNGGALLDSVAFGVQVPDLSIGRATDGAWVLCRPTFGVSNVALPLGDPHDLKINEWLADELFMANNDFIELFNPNPLPVALGGCFLSNAEGAPALNPIPALSFIAAGGYVTFTADSDAARGADHVNFKLDAEVGIILLSDPDLDPIDIINYGPQRTDVAQGRSPSGSDVFVSFAQPTPGAPNPVPYGAISVTNITSVVRSLLAMTNTWKLDNSGGTNLGTAWQQPGFNDSGWPGGTGLFGYETTPAEYLPYTFQTYVPPPNTNGGHISTYYRTHFQWNGGLANFTLLATNYLDDGAVFYLNGVRVGSVRMPATVTYSTLATQQLNEGSVDLVTFPTNNLVTGDNVMAVELHQNATSSSDNVFGMFLNAIQYTTDVVTTAATGVPVVLNEILASNHLLTNADGTTSDWLELFNPATNAVNLADLSLSDDPNAPRKFVFGPGVIIAPAGFLLVYCNNNLPASTNNTGFSLNAGGGSVFFFNSLASGGGLIDAVTFGLQTPDFSIGRLPSGTGPWALNVATPGTLNAAAGLGSASSLAVNEWMADPVSGSDWFELYNSGLQPVALGGLFFTDDLTKKTLSPIPPLSFIGTGANAFLQFHADSDPNAGADHVNFKLSKSGDTIGLYSPAGMLITAITFGAQQNGVSQGRFPDGSANLASFTVTASPGESNYLPLPTVVVNEVLTHTDLPLEDSIELFNAGPGSVDVSGWFISNTRDNLKAYRFPDGSTIPARDFKVLYEFQFNPTNGSSAPFTLNSAHGDKVYLSEADGSGNLTGYRAVARFGAAANGVSFGRYTNSVGHVDFVAMSHRSFGADNPSTVAQFRTGTGAQNPYPLVGPVVVNEIMYDPARPDPLEDNTADEYIELLNLTPNTVPLYDPNAATNSWALQGGVDFSFPPGVTLPPGGSLLVVNFDPVADSASQAEFRARYSLSNGVALYGPYRGHLANSGESIGLYKPDPPQLPPHPDAGFVPYVLVDQIDYLNVGPWPTGANATGLSLQRRFAALYGNDPANWFVAAPSAAQSNALNSLDSDSDGLPDEWELQYFSSISDPQASPNADPDGDGFTNLQEYLAGTNPLDANSCLKIDVASVAGSTATIQFTAVAGKTYSVLYRDNPAAGAWLKLSDVPAQSQTCFVTVNDPSLGTSTARFYRLATPALP
jgi:hypothetical protein